MTHDEEIQIRDKIVELIEVMNSPSRKNQIRDEKLKKMISLLSVEEHNAWWCENEMDKPGDMCDEMALEISEAFAI